MKAFPRHSAVPWLLGTALLSSAACRGTAPAPASAAAASPATVTVVKARRGAISRSIVLPAVVRPLEQAVLYAKVAGYLKTIRVDRGDSVHEGDLLAEIESPELVADLTRQKAEVAVAEAAYRRASEAQKKAPDLVMPQSVDDAKGRLDMAEASLERTETLLSYTKIRAPLAGVVTKRSVDPGAFIPAATSGSVVASAALLTIMDIRTVRIQIPVPEPEVPLVAVGLPVAVAVDELPGHVFEGRVTRFAYALDEASKTMEAEAEVANPKSELRPGMYARATIGMERKTEALLIPASALVPGKGQNFVFTVADGKAKRLAVKIGFRDDANVQVLEGLAPDQSVVLAGANPPADGQPVTVVEGR
ncbi:MAG: efflux RND transporter periplasmic adaptor subunit [Vicinamibacteria bacterium]